MMPTRVLSGPEPIATPADIAGDHAEDDAKIAAIVAAIQAEIDGPQGWLGRALGKQTLELTMPDFSCEEWTMLYGPVIGDITSVKYLDADLVEYTLAPEHYTLAGNAIRRNFSFTLPPLACRPDAIRIVYEAGYDGEEIATGGTGPVPPNAKLAVILGVQQLKSIGAENLFLRSEEVEGVGTFQYTVSEKAGEIIHKATDRLLSGLRVYV